MGVTQLLSIITVVITAQPYEWSNVYYLGMFHYDKMKKDQSESRLGHISSSKYHASDSFGRVKSGKKKLIIYILEAYVENK